MQNFYKISLTVLALLGLTQANAQITLTEADAPSINDAYPVIYDTTDVASVDIGTTGNNQSWDYSSLNSDQEDTILFLDPAATPSGNDFPSANLSQPYSDGFIYMTKTQTNIDIIGITYDTLSIPFNNPVTYITFPTDINTSYSDLGSATVTVPYDTSILGQDIDSVRLKRDITLNFQTQGWGNLTTPLNTYDNTLKIYRQEIDVDSIWIHINSILGSQWQFYDTQNDTVEYYSWHTNQIGNPLLEIKSKSDTVRSVYFLNDPQQQTSVQNFAQNNSIIVYPNPSNDKFSFICNQEIISVKIFDETGKLIVDKNINQAKTFSWKPKKSGIYFALFYDHTHNIVTKQKLIAIE